MHDLDLYNEPTPIVNVTIKSQYTTSYMLTIVIFALSVTVCETNKMVSIWIFDLQKVGHGHEQQGCRIHRLMAFYGLQDGWKMMDLSQTVYIG